MSPVLAGDFFTTEPPRRPNSFFFLIAEYSLYWASLVVKLVQNPPAMQETLVQFLDQEGPLEKG